VNIIFGPESDTTKFTINENLICHFSPVSKAALEGNFKEALDGLMPLEHTDAKIFLMLQHWLYHQELDFDADEESNIKYLLLLLSLWNLGDQYMMAGLQNHAMNACTF